jgi:hypothetical protein
MHWFRRWITREQSLRAYFRPTDTPTLDATLVPLIDCIVTVRFVGLARAGAPFAGQRLYKILGPGKSGARFVRPAHDFDFLE